MGEDTFLFFRALGINLKQFYGQTETAALTAAQTDGGVTLHARRPADARRRRQDRRQRRNPGAVRLGDRRLFRRSRSEPKGFGRRLAAYWRRRLSRAERATRGARARQRSGAHRGGRALHPELHREPHQVQRLCPQRRRDRRRPRRIDRDRLHRSRSGGTLGRGERASLTPPMPTCRNSRRFAGSSPACCATSTKPAGAACASAASSTCTRISMPTTARSRAPASCGATSSRNATPA